MPDMSEPERSNSATNEAREAREHLAACYRFFAARDMDDSIYTHLSARVPGADGRFLFIPFGMLFGRGDRILDYRQQGEAMKQKCPALDLVLIDGGHMPLLVKPDTCVEMIRKVAAKRYP